MRRWILVLAAAALVLLVAGVLHLAYRPIQVDPPQFITIESGESTAEIADQLDRQGLLRSKRLFIWWAKLRQIDRRLQPGRYEVSGPTAMADVLDDMRSQLERWMHETDDPLLKGPVAAPAGAKVNDPDGISPQEPTITV